jgi:rubrerythrin
MPHVDTDNIPLTLPFEAARPCLFLLSDCLAKFRGIGEYNGKNLTENIRIALRVYRDSIGGTNLQLEKIPDSKKQPFTVYFTEEDSELVNWLNELSERYSVAPSRIVNQAMLYAIAALQQEAKNV